MKQGVDFIGVGVGAFILNEKDELLLTLRSKSSRNEACMWELPGGGVEFGEKIEDAVKREVLEEVGVKVDIIRLIKLRNHFTDGQHWVTPAYLCKITRGVPRIMEKDKFDDLRWFSMDNLPENTSSITKEAVDAYKG